MSVLANMSGGEVYFGGVVFDGYYQYDEAHKAYVWIPGVCFRESDLWEEVGCLSGCDGGGGVGERDHAETYGHPAADDLPVCMSDAECWDNNGEPDEIEDWDSWDSEDWDELYIYPEDGPDSNEVFQDCNLFPHEIQDDIQSDMHMDHFQNSDNFEPT